MRVVLLLSILALGLVGCSSGGDVSSQTQADKAATLDKISKSGPGGDKVGQ